MIKIMDKKIYNVNKVRYGPNMQYLYPIEYILTSSMEGGGSSIRGGGDFGGAQAGCALLNPLLV